MAVQKFLAARLGLDEDIALAYTQVLDGLGPEQLEAGLRERMVEMKLLRSTPDGFSVLPVHDRLELSADEMTAEAGRLLEAARQLRLRYESGDRSQALWLHDRPSVVAAYERLQEEANGHVHALDKGPHPAESHQQSPPQARALERGVVYRVVYGQEVLLNPTLLSVMRQSVRDGEQARLMRRVPMNLLVADDQAALLTLPGPDESHEAILVRPGRFLTVLTELFHICWELGAPLPPEGPVDHEGPDESSLRLLALMAAGLTDESIARELGVSQRTVARRISRLQGQLAAQSRFQMGVQAIRRGWLGPSATCRGHGGLTPWHRPAIRIRARPRDAFLG